MQQQSPGKKKYLWSYAGSHHGAGKQLRIVLDGECKLSDRCHGHFKPTGAGYLKECGGNLFNKHTDRRHDHGCKATMDVTTGQILVRHMFTSISRWLSITAWFRKHRVQYGVL